MNMGVLVHSDRAMGQGNQREVPIPKKKWIKDYFKFGLGNPKYIHVHTIKLTSQSLQFIYKKRA